MLNVEKPISSRSEDFLDRKNFSDNISKAILNYKDVNKSSLTIGLYGKWGSGKTSIVNMITEKLEGEDDVIIFKFEPWIFSDTQQLISSFFKEFAKVIKHKDNASEALKIGEELETYATFFEPMSLIPEPTVSILSAISVKVFSSIGKASKKWGQLKTKNLSATKASIENHLHKLDKKILIIVDDIDRLNNTEIRQVFQMIKVLGNFPNTIYLSSMDKAVVIDALSEVQKGDGSEYLEKIINVPFDVPSISKSDVEKFLFKKLNEVVKDISDRDFDHTYWGNIYHGGFKQFFKNIRDVIRYINVLRFNYSFLSSKVNAIDLIAITGFQVFEPKIYKLLKHNKDYLTGAIPERQHGEDDIKEDIKTFIEDSYKNLQVLPQDDYLNLLQELFIKVNEVYSNTHYVGYETECRKEAKLCSPEFFDTYFTMTLDSDEISSQEMKQYIDLASDEEKFRELILSLVSNDKITRFLERLQDYTSTDIQTIQFQTIVDVLMDLGDSFPKGREGMFATDNNMQIMRIVHQLSARIENEKERFALLKEAIQNTENSISTICLKVSILMQENGEYDREAKPEDQLTITSEHLQELKNIFKEKIERWATEALLFDHRDALSILYLWKKLDNDSVIKYIEENINDGSLMKFLNMFVSYSYSHGIGDYTARKNREFNYENINDFLDPDRIIDKVKSIHSSFDKDTDELVKFSVESFLKNYNNEISDEDEL